MIKCYSGLPGSGKTTYLTQIGIKNIKKGNRTYSNYPIFFTYKGVKLTSNIINSREEMIKQPYQPGDIIIIDEAQRWFNSREYKKFGNDLLEFFTGHRHIDVDIYIGVQYPQRIDVSIREIVDTYHWLSKIFIFKSILRERKYILFEDILRESEMPEEYLKENFKSKLRIIKNKKKLFTSFNSKYLKSQLSQRFNPPDQYKQYPFEQVQYVSLFKQLKTKIQKKKEFNQHLKELKLEQSNN
jgi:hypothetical protein